MTAHAREKKTRASAARVRARILIVDDHPIVRLGLGQLIGEEEDMAVCGEATSAPAAKAAIRELKPDAVVVDISLKQGDGIELVRESRAKHPTLPILVLSNHDEKIYAERMLSAGASGYIMKRAPPDEFLRALRRVLGGSVYVSAQVGDTIIQKFVYTGTRISANPIDRLSNRELQILQMIGRGLSTREAAEALRLSVKTLESHRQRIKRKLNLVTGSQLVQFAVSWYSELKPTPPRETSRDSEQAPRAR